MTHYSDIKKMKSFSAKEFPLNRESYELLEEVGQGVSAKVHRALCIPLNKVVAIKVMDLERGSSVLDAARREVHTMSLVNHPNLLNAYCSFTAGRKLWIVLPYMGGGSCLHIMKSAYPDGFEEPVIATMLHETLKALAYLHAQGNIHRDVKAGNMLIDSKGTVKLGDFGVSASMFDSGQRQITRNTFVGTPCWMAPEVMQQLHGYDFKADIWSFGITALELAHGHAPFSKYPPMKVLLMTLQNAPPGLDYERDKKFSKSFKEIVAACLVKDPAMRPTSEKLLSHRFFKQSRLSGFLAQTILSQLPPLGDRYRVLKEREAELFLQKNTMFEDREQLSQQEYMRGISAWKFDVEDLRRQAALLQDCDGISNSENNCLSRKQAESDTSSVCNSNSSKSTPSQEDGSRGINNAQSVEKSPTSYITTHALDDHLDAHLRCTSAGYSNQNNPSSVEDALEAFWSINGKGMHRFDSDNGTQNGHANANCGASTNYANTTTTSIVPSLQCILQQNNLIKEHLLRTIKSVDSCTEGKRVSKAQHLQMFSAYAKEMELRSQIINMKQRIGKLVEELHEQKMKNAELERKLTASLNKE